MALNETCKFMKRLGEQRGGHCDSAVDVNFRENYSLKFVDFESQAW